MSGDSNSQEQAMEALHSLTDFHQGSWGGKVTSFTVTADVAAGIVQKKTAEYSVDVKISTTPAGDLAINELYSWGDKQSAPRMLPISDSSVDCDSVDGSYSLHSSNQPDYLLALADLSGTEKEVHFSVEECIATSNDSRTRMMALYGEKNDLVRVMVCEETRLPESAATAEGGGMSLTASDLLELQSDVDRLVDKIAGQVQGATPDPTTSSDNSNDEDKAATPSEPEDRLQRLQESLARQQQQQQKQSSAADNSDATPYTAYPMSLLEITSGVWLGDSIVRDFRVGRNAREGTGRKGGGKGFGSPSPRSDRSDSNVPFGSWAVGVQKVAREWLWDFEEQVRQNNEAGKSMGVAMEAGLSKSMGGSVCENQSLSRRIAKEERMVYIDWDGDNGGDPVGFLLGSVSIQVPRYITFGDPRSKPFYAELCVYQTPEAKKEDSASTDGGVEAVIEDLPEVVCSRICRLYDSEGQLQQGCTSFYSLKRFDA